MSSRLRRRFSLLHRVSLIASAATLFLAAATSALAGPFVNTSNTPVAITGATLVITGGNFDTTPANNTVQFNDGAAGTVTAATTSSLSINLTTPPASTGSLTAVVNTDGQSSGSPVQVAVVQPVVQFSAASGNVYATDGTFSIPVTVTGSPFFNNGATPAISPFLSGFNFPVCLAFDTAGNLYVGDEDAGTVSRITPTGTKSTFASGFHYPVGLACDAAGNLYVSNKDQNGSGIISKVTPAGAVSTFASGLNFPRGLAFDSAGNLYVADSNSGTISKVTPDGMVNPYASGLGSPTALAIDAVGNLYVSNENVADRSYSYILKILPGGVATSFGFAYGYNFSLCLDQSGNLFVTYISKNDWQSWYLGVLLPNGAMNTLISGLTPSMGLAVDSAGYLYAGLNRISPAASVPFTISGTAVAGVDYSGVTSSPLKLVKGQATAFITGTLTPNPGITPTLVLTLGTPTGALLQSPATTTLNLQEPAPSVTPATADLAMNAPSIILHGTFSPAAANNTVTFNNGAAGTVSSATATALTVTFTTPPTQLGRLTATVTANGVSTGQAVQVATVVPGLSLAPSPIALNTTTLMIHGAGFDPIAGNNAVLFSGGVVGTVTAATTTQLTVTLTTPPTSIGPLTAVVTTDGLSSGSPITIGTVVSIVQFGVASESTRGDFSIPVTLTGTPTFSNGVPPYAQVRGAEFSSPTALAFDAARLLYVASSGGVVTKVFSGGNYSTFATGFTTIGGLVCDAAGNLYVSDRSANTVSKITPSGTVSVFASGFSAPTKMVFDTEGNLYVANAGSGIIQRVTPGGAVSTFASGFSVPSGLVFDANGNLYVANYGNGTVSRVTPAGMSSTFASGLNSPLGVGFDSEGYLLVPSIDTSGLVTRLASGPNTGLNTISLMTDQPARRNSSIIIINPDRPNGSIFRVSPAGAATSFVTGLLSPTDLVSDAVGNFYITNVDLGYNEYGGHNGLVTEFSPSVSVDFTIGGGVNGVDYYLGNNNGYFSTALKFIPGQTTLYIWGTLLTNTALTFTLGTPAGAVIGTPATNTLTFASAPTVTASTASLPINASTIVLHGSSFDPVAANNTVTFNNGAIGTVTDASNTSLTVTFSTPPQSLGPLAVAVTSYGQSSGTPVTVATIVMPPPAAFTGGATFAATMATLSGTVNAKGSDTNVSFDYGPTTAYGKTVVARPARVSGTLDTIITATLTGLLPATQYHFRIKGVSTAGTTLGEDNTFTTRSNVATLASLALSNAILSPIFKNTTVKYTATDYYATVAITPTASESHARITINGSPVASGSSSATLNLSPGNNLIKVVVTAEDGITQKTYSLKIKRVSLPVATFPTSSALFGGSGTFKHGEAPSVAQTFALPALPTTLTSESSSDPTSLEPARTAATPEPIKARLTGPTANGGVLPGGRVTFTWDAGRGIGQYWLAMGSAVGETDLYDGSQGLALSQTVSLPTDGQEVYVALHSLINGIWKTNSYVFTAAGTSALVATPADDAVLTGPDLALTWKAVPEITHYWLSIGSTEEGADIYDADQGTALTQSVTVPTDGRELFITLKTNCRGVWTQSTRTVTAAGTGAPRAAHLISPTSIDSAVLPTGDVTFTWDAGTEVSEYRLSIGSSAIATDLYNASQGTRHTITINLPEDGSPLYVTLSSLIRGTWVANQYLYQAPVPP